MHSQHSECFWNRQNAAWPLRGEPNSGHAVPTAATAQLASNPVSAISPCLAILFTQMLVVTSFANDNRFGPVDMSDGAVTEHNRWQRLGSVEHRNVHQGTHWQQFMFPRLLCLTNTPVITHCKRSQAHDRNAVHTPGSFGKHSYSGALAKCLPGHCDGVAEWYCSHTHTQVPCLLVKYNHAVGTQRQVPTWYVNWH